MKLTKTMKSTRLRLEQRMSDKNRDLHIAILEYLQRLSKQPGSLDCDSIDIASQMLAESLAVDMFEKGTKDKFLSQKNLTLEDVFAAGLSPSGSSSSASSGAKKVAAGPKSIDDISQADLAQAEKFKNDGNTSLAANPTQAYEFYSKAIELNPFNHIYWNNRAVASYKTEDYEKTVADCKRSIQIKANYSKSHYRLGLAFTELGKYGDAVTTLERAKDVAQDAQENAMVNEIENAIKIAKKKQTPSTSTPANANPMGGMDFGALASMMGGAGGAGGLDIASIMQNPMFASMAQNIMGSMGGMEGIQAMMNGGGTSMGQGQGDDDYDDEDYEDIDEDDHEDDDDDVETVTRAPAAGPGGLDLSGIDTSDPMIQRIMAEVQSNPMAAMQYLNNPEVMAKLGPVIQQMMGGGAGRR